MRVLPSIVVAQFFCTSLWFAGNAVIGDLTKELSLTASFAAHLTSAVQGGFIAGTLVFALLALADRFSPSKLFGISALVAALLNALATLPGLDGTSLLLLRFATGFCLAGVYPVGMKIAADHYREGLGRSLGFLVGALVLGTALPHLLKSFTIGLPWRSVFYATSALSLIGGLLVAFGVPDGIYRRKSGQFGANGLLLAFRNKSFRAAAFGYFGHMWELYAFWTFLPFALSSYAAAHQKTVPVSFYSFLIIASGTAACIVGGQLSSKRGASPIARSFLFLSGICCAVSPLFLQQDSVAVLFAFFLIWGASVVGDSPLFSTLVALHAPPEVRGSALTIVNCTGFSITIVSIQLLALLNESIPGAYLFLFLLPGPALGLFAMKREKNS